MELIFTIIVLFFNWIILQTTSVRVPSPVKVISHFKEDAGQRNRFSSDFNDQKAVSAKSQQGMSFYVLMYKFLWCL